MRKIQIVVGVLLLFFATTFAFAQHTFVVRHIRIQGLEGITKTTVLSYMPIKVGETLTSHKSEEVISSLYKTGFFDDISLRRSGDTLVVKVKQRPIIGRITITGNKDIPTKKLQKALKKMHFFEGDVYNPSVLEKVKGSLESQYFISGKYNARVNSKVTKEPRNRVAIDINISEGQVSKIHQITIIGCTAYTQRELLRQFRLTTPGLFTFFTHNDRYSKEKLTADLESLKSYYMDQGYIRFKIDSTQVLLSPDRKQVYIVIRITEGGQYRFSGFTFSGKLILPKKQLMSYVAIKPGDIFSRKAIMVVNKKLMQVFGEKGYANADIEAVPKIDDKKHTVFLNFHVKPGPHIYVRHVTFSNNYRTNDDALRREIQQMEGGVISTRQIESSKRSLMLLPYISAVNVTTHPVPGKNNQVDVNYKVKEAPAAEFKAGISYSQLEQFMVNASVEQKNLFGTGNSLGVNFMYSKPSSALNLSYYNPYAFASGIGRSVNVYTSHFDSSDVNLTDFATDNYGGSVGYNWPVTLNNSIQFGYGYENDVLKVGSNPSTQIQDFINKHNRHFYQLSLNGGWTYQGLDRYLFPTDGVLQTLNVMGSAPLSNTRSLKYYTIESTTNYYRPIYHSFIGQLKADVGYGNGYGSYGGELPFFKNFYAGGIGSVRGYEGNTLGPRDSNDNPIGGNFKLVGSAALIVPNPIGDTVRTSFFVDGGNVYNTRKKAGQGGIHLNELRYSAGFEVDWRSPIALLSFSIAEPLHKRKGDKTEWFQFNIGSSL